VVGKGREGLMGRGGDGKGAVGREEGVGRGGREGEGRGRGKEGKGRAGRAFRQVKIYDYTPAPAYGLENGSYNSVTH